MNNVPISLIYSCQVLWGEVKFCGGRSIDFIVRLDFDKYLEVIVNQIS